MNRTTQGKTDLLLCRYSVNRPGLTIESNIRRASFVHRITIKVCGGFNLAQARLWNFSYRQRFFTCKALWGRVKNCYVKI